MTLKLFQAIEEVFHSSVDVLDQEQLITFYKKHQYTFDQNPSNNLNALKSWINIHAEIALAYALAHHFPKAQLASKTKKII